MKLYYAPGACSYAPHLVINEAGLNVELVKVDLRAHTTEHGDDFYAINPKGYVPYLEIGAGEGLSEAAAILQYLGDQSAEVTLIPAAGERARYHVVEWLTFISSEIHKGFGGFFRPDLPESEATLAKEKLAKRFAYIESQLEDGRSYLAGEDFTVADAYLFTVMNWRHHVGVEIQGFPKLSALLERIAARPAVTKTSKEEGLA